MQTAVCITQFPLPVLCNRTHKKWVVGASLWYWQFRAGRMVRLMCSTLKKTRDVYSYCRVEAGKTALISGWVHCC